MGALRRLPLPLLLLLCALPLVADGAPFNARGQRGAAGAAGATGPAGPSLAGLPVADAAGFGGYGVIRVPLVAGDGLSDDDVTVYASTSPALRILSVTAMLTAGPGTGTATVRSATGGGGTAYSAAFAVSATGLQAETTSRTTTQTLSANTSIYVRRAGTGQGNGIVGEVLIYVQRTS